MKYQIGDVVDCDDGYTSLTEATITKVSKSGCCVFIGEDLFHVDELTMIRPIELDVELKTDAIIIKMMTEN